MFTLRDFKNIEKPSRYLGGEVGEIIKNKRNNMRVAVVLPDVYENAIINENFQSIYHELNLIQNIWCERVFSPKPDFEQLIRHSNNLIYTLESKTNINQMHVLIFVIDDEMQYTNALNILNLGKIPILRARRNIKHPIIIFTGKSILNVKVLEKFCDLFIIGETKNIVGDICKEYLQYYNNQNLKDSYINSLVNKEGIYISESNRKVKYLKTKQFKYELFGNLVVSSMFTKYNTNIVQATRGCDSISKICRESYIYNDMQIKQNIIEEIKEKKRLSGEENVTILTNCIAKAKHINEIIYNIEKDLSLRDTQISVCNLLLNKENLNLLKYIPKNDIPTIFAGGVLQNAKEILGVGEQIKDIQYMAKHIFKAGFSKLRLIYMIGLPKENYDDLSKIITTAESIVNIYLDEYPNNTTTNIVDIELKYFYPISYTQTERLEASTPDKLELKLRYIVEKNNNTYVTIKSNLPYKYCLKTILSRGDEKISNVIYDAWKNGARFCNDDLLFNKEAWKIAIQKNKINIKEYLDKIDENRILPWENVVINIDEEIF